MHFSYVGSLALGLLGSAHNLEKEGGLEGRDMQAASRMLGDTPSAHLVWGVPEPQPNPIIILNKILLLSHISSDQYVSLEQIERSRLLINSPFQKATFLLPGALDSPEYPSFATSGVKVRGGEGRLAWGQVMATSSTTCVHPPKSKLASHTL